MRKVITYGTFDLLHIGHIHLLRRARELGDHLTVAVSTDEFNEGKGKKTILPFAERLEIVKSIRYVDEVIPETCWEQKTDDVRRLGISVFTMGDDWEFIGCVGLEYGKRGLWRNNLGVASSGASGSACEFAGHTIRRIGCCMPCRLCFHADGISGCSELRKMVFSTIRSTFFNMFPGRGRTSRRFGLAIAMI